MRSYEIFMQSPIFILFIFGLIKFYAEAYLHYPFYSPDYKETYRLVFNFETK